MSSPPVGGPVIPKRRIARELRRLREERRLPLERLAEETEVSTSTLSRLENAQGAANALTIRAIVDYYKLSGTDLGEKLKLWAKQGRKHGWWQDFPEDAAGESGISSAPFVAYEWQAKAVSLYVIPYVPVLLQTSNYVRELAKTFDPHRTEQEIEQRVDYTLHRQGNLALRDDLNLAPLQLRAILHEACLYQRVGSAKIMQEQLESLLSLVESHVSNVDIRVLSRMAQAHRSTRSSWAVFEFPDEIDTEIAFAETHLNSITVEGDRIEEVKRHFTELSSRSLDANGTVKSLKSAIRSWSGGED